MMLLLAATFNVILGTAITQTTAYHFINKHIARILMFFGLKHVLNKS